MEDISRELEREVAAQPKPEPFQRKKDSQILIVDALGNMRDGRWLSRLNRFLVVLAVVGWVLGAGSLYLYTRQAAEQGQLLERIETLRDKTKRLTREREILMARLMIYGKEPGLQAKQPSADPQPNQDLAESNSNASSLAQDAQEESPAPKETLLDKLESAPVVKINKFKYRHNPQSRVLKLGFDIQNISGNTKGISGRVFAVVVPSDESQAPRVLPRAVLKDGVPVDPSRGQYFSIARFKPVEFKFETNSAELEYKWAWVYVYNDRGHMVCREKIEMDKGGAN